MSACGVDNVSEEEIGLDESSDYVIDYEQVLRRLLIDLIKNESEIFDQALRSVEVRTLSSAHTRLILG